MIVNTKQIISTVKKRKRIGWSLPCVQFPTGPFHSLSTQVRDHFVLECWQPIVMLPSIRSTHASFGVGMSAQPITATKNEARCLLQNKI